MGRVVFKSGASYLLKVGRVVLGRVLCGASCLGASCLWGELSVIRRTDAGAWVYCNFGSGELQSISQRHDESGDANMRKLDLSMKYFRSQDQIVLMRKSKIHIKQILSD